MSTDASGTGAFREGAPQLRQPRPTPPRPVWRYAVTIAVLMLMVAGIAWITQYLPNWRRQVDVEPPPEPKKLLEFPREVAFWGPAKSTDPTDAWKYVEAGDPGHYDFLFQNVTAEDVNLAFCRPSCDCASVKACVLSAAEWKHANEQQKARPGVAIEYSQNPDWRQLPPEPSATGKAAAKGEIVRVPVGGGGAIRIEWVTKDSPGHPLNLTPEIFYQGVDNPSRRGVQRVVIPGMIVAPIEYYPNRLDFGSLAPGRSVAKSFHVWSSTQKSLDLSMLQNPPDPLFVYTIKPALSKEAAAELQKSLPPHVNGVPIKVLCAYPVELTIHETKGERNLDQGAFYRKSQFVLNGKVDPNRQWWGPEVIGRVDGDIRIGGDDDKGRIKFRSFSAREGASREIFLSTDAKVKLDRIDAHVDQPSFVKVALSEVETQSGRTRWRLEVTIPPEQARPGRFDEPNAVVLRILPAGRQLRIPLEGFITK
jgi:hypothetical protein